MNAWRTFLLAMPTTMLCAALCCVPIRFGAARDEYGQTLSDRAQSTTIAFDGLAFLTSSLGADSFLPPGKVADFSGFQYLRDNDPTEMGHNTDFVTIIARNILNLLSDAQVTQMVERAEVQRDRIGEYGYLRFPLMDAFRRQLTNDIPAGSDSMLALCSIHASGLWDEFTSFRIARERDRLYPHLQDDENSERLAA